MHLDGLDQNAKVVKTLRSTHVELDDGRVFSQPQLFELERAALRSRFGAMTPMFANGVRAAPRDMRVKVAIFFSIAPLSAELERGLWSANDQERSSSQQKLQQTIADGLSVALPFVADAGVDIKQTTTTIPMIYGEATPDIIESVAHLQLVTLVLGAEAGKRVLHGAKNGVTDPQIDISFNASAHWGFGQKIGHVEDTQAGLLDNHEAFSFATSDPITLHQVTYQVEPPDCTIVSDCPAASGGNVDCRALGHAGHPKQCVNIHASECMSITAGSTGGSSFGAGRAHYFYPNESFGTNPTQDQCNPPGLVHAYDWLQIQGVTTVNESFGCTIEPPTPTWAHGAALEGITEDYYASKFGIHISKSAGNIAIADQAIGAACPYSLNSTCVGANLAGGGPIGCYSSFNNLNGPPTGIRTDREEPDITMFGGGIICSAGPDVDVASMSGGWTVGSGTSFAAPQAASLSALCKEVAGGSMDQKQVRAILKVSGWTHNIIDFRYSMGSTTLGPDWKDGGGNPLGGAVQFMCSGGGPPGGGGPGGRSGLNPGDTNGGTPFPFANIPCPWCNRNNPPLGRLATNGDLRTESATPPSMSDGRKYTQLFGPQPLINGNRIRAVIAWDSCPGGPMGVAPAPVITDYDLFLAKDLTVIDGSQTVTDNTEGFDVNVVSGSGNYSVWIAWPAGTPTCAGGGMAPYAWAVNWWH